MPVTIVEAARALRRHWRVPAVVIVLCLVAVPFVLSATETTTQFVSTATLQVDQVSTLPQLAGEGQIGFVTSPDVSSRAREIAGDDASGRATVTATVVASEQASNPDFLTIRVTSARRGTPEAVARAQAQAFIEKRASLEKASATQALQTIDQRITEVTQELNQLQAQKAATPRQTGDAAAIDGQIAALTDRINKLSLSRVPLAELQTSATGDAQVLAVSAASASSTSSSSRIGALALLAVLGLALGVGGAVLIGRLLPPVIHGPDDAAATFGGAILAIVPRRKGREREPLVLHERGRSRARAIHAAAAMLESAGTVPPRLLVAGVDAPQATALMGVNLAVSLARHGHQVTIVGTDQTHERALANLGVTSKVGYGDLVQKAGAGDVTVDVDSYLFAAEGVEGVWVLAPGDRRSTAPLKAVEQILGALETGGFGAGICLVLAPPEYDDPHTPVLARLTGAAVWVVDNETTRADHARLMADRLAQAGAPTAGVVLIGK